MSEAFKLKQLYKLADVRDRLKKQPRLTYLFIELTDRCNLACRHCGSSCELGTGRFLEADRVIFVLDSILLKYPSPSIMICLTGGEPLLHPEFFRIAAHIQKLGYPWGITTNGTLIDDDRARRMKQTGMGSVSVSLDGLKAEHDLLRSREGCYERAVQGIRNMQKAGLSVQVTTVVSRLNFDSLEDIYLSMLELGVDSWRPINIEPIGRARSEEELLLTDTQILDLIEFIQEKRFSGDPRMEVTFGCSHYLTPKYERMVRNNYFICGAGILVCGILANGDITACLDIEHRPELIQGNIFTDDLSDVWENRFEIYRTDRTEHSEFCRICEVRHVCGGDSAHTWDYDNNKPLICFHRMQKNFRGGSNHEDN